MPDSKVEYQDALFRRVAAEHGNITTLLDSFFGFLKRNTDFYIINDDPASTVGFPRGTAERLTLGAFRKYAVVDVTPSPVQSAARGKSERTLGATANKQLASQSSSVGALQSTGTSAEHGAVPAVSSSKPAPQRTFAVNECAPTEARGSEGRVDPSTRPRTETSGFDILHNLRTTLKTSSRKDSEGKCLQVPVANGGIAASYWWEQSLSNVVLYFALRFVQMCANPVAMCLCVCSF